MSENTNETVNAPEGFNLADWLIGGTEHRAHKKAIIYRDATLPAKVEEVEAKMRLAQKDAETGNSMDSLGDSTLAQLEDEQRALLAQLEAAKAEVTVFGLIDEEDSEAVQAAGENPSTLDVAYQILERAGTLNGQKLTAEQWHQLHQTVGTQFNLVTRAYREAKENPVDARFRS